jgi:broad specificity phosphatase PhoE
MSSELCTFYIVRHFDKVTSRIDGNFPSCFTEEEIQFYYDNKYDTNPNILINPYICDNTKDRVLSITQNLSGIKFDYVISSPFLRAMETALDLINFKIKGEYVIDIEHRELFVDFGLCAIFKEFKFPPGLKLPTSININTIYKNSLKFIHMNDKKRKAYEHNNITLIKNVVSMKITSNDDYATRFFETFTNLQKCPEYAGKNILVVTHGASLTKWYGETVDKMYQQIRFKYGSVYKLRELDLNKKPQKITMKIGILLLTIENPFFPDNLKEYLNENTKLYIHAKYPDKIDSYFKKYLIKKLVDTKWGDMSLVSATLNLLEDAYNECNYFYLISGDTYIINKPEIFDLSCFDFMKEYNGIYKSSQWWGLNKQDAKILINTRNKYKDYFKNIKLDGAYDENYFLTVLNKQVKNYKYTMKRVMYVKWLDNVIAKHPIIFNKLTECNIYLSRNSFFIRKSLKTFKNEKVSTREKLHIFYIGSETNQNEILKMDLKNIDYVLITSIEIDKIDENIIKNTFYIMPIIWKFYEETKKSLEKDIILSSWNKILFYPEKFKI